MCNVVISSRHSGQVTAFLVRRGSFAKTTLPISKFLYVSFQFKAKKTYGDPGSEICIRNKIRTSTASPMKQKHSHGIAKPWSTKEICSVQSIYSTLWLLKDLGRAETGHTLGGDDLFKWTGNACCSHTLLLLHTPALPIGRRRVWTLIGWAHVTLISNRKHFAGM